MNQLNEYKQTSSFKVKTLINLLDNLRSALFYYILTYKQILTLKEDEFDKSRYDEFKNKLIFFKRKIIQIYDDIEKLFNNGFFIELSDEEAKNISLSYRDVVQEYLVASETAEDERYKQFTDLISFYENTILPDFKKLNDNITVYNNTAIANNWKYKLMTYKEAFNYHQNNRRSLYSKGI